MRSFHLIHGHFETSSSSPAILPAAIGLTSISPATPSTAFVRGMGNGTESQDATEKQDQKHTEHETTKPVGRRARSRAVKKGFSKYKPQVGRHWKQQCLECHRDFYECMNILSRHFRISIRPDGSVHILPKRRGDDLASCKDVSRGPSKVSEESAGSSGESPIPATPNSEEVSPGEVPDPMAMADKQVEKLEEQSPPDNDLAEELAETIIRLGELLLLAVVRLAKNFIFVVLKLSRLLWLAIKNGIVLRVLAFCGLVGDCAYFLRKCRGPPLKGIHTLHGDC